MSDLIDGKLNGWPVSILIERDLGGRACGAHCAAYSDESDAEPSQEIMGQCDGITDACDGLPPTRALARAKSMGFVPEEE